MDKYWVGTRTLYCELFENRNQQKRHQNVSKRYHSLKVLLCRGFAPTLLPVTHFLFNNPLSAYFKDFKDMTRGWLSETVTTYLRTPVTSKPGTATLKYHTLTVEYWGETKQKRVQKQTSVADLGFLRGGGANSKGGCEEPLFGNFFPKNCPPPPAGGHASLTPP